MEKQKANDIMTLVEDIILIFCGYGFTDFGEAVRDSEKNIIESPDRLEGRYSADELDDLVYKKAEPIALRIGNTLSDMYSKLFREEEVKLENNPHPQPSNVGLPSMFCSGNPGHSVWENITGNKAKFERAVKQHYSLMTLFKAGEEGDEGWQLADYQDGWFIGDAHWDGQVGTSSVSYDERPDPLHFEHDLHEAFEEASEVWVETSKER